jgi:hypothetical protein
MEQNAHACRKFFLLLPKHTTSAQLARFVVAVYENLHCAIAAESKGKKKNEELEKGNHNSINLIKRALDIHLECQPILIWLEDPQALVSGNIDQFLDILGIFMDSLVPELAKTKNSKLKSLIVNAFEKQSLAKLMSKKRNKIGMAAIFYIARHALASNFTEISQECQAHLHEVN